MVRFVTEAIEPSIAAIVRRATGAGVLSAELVQRLWSGYGRILRCRLDDATTVIVKHVHPPTQTRHPRGWGTSRGHERKVRSYAVERAFYADWAPRCDASCRVPRCLAQREHDGETWIVLEDLDAAGFDRRHAPNDVASGVVRAGLRWLAHFHATFVDAEPEGLWPVGTYWHLDTRPDELAELPDGALKRAAPVLDRALTEARPTTLVHGDAKLANFCVAGSGSVAAVDFQYVGGGCGIKDVAYFIGSCLDEDEAERQETALLDAYFDDLRIAMTDRGHEARFDGLHETWRALYPVAWTDFYRFLQGWSPGHWKIHRYSERLAREVLEGL